jgi:hypothetical protein
VVAITVAAIVRDTPGMVPAVRDIVRVTLGTVVLPAIVHPLQLFQVRAIVLQLQPFQVQGIARMLPVAVRGRAGECRALCRPMEGTVRTRLRAHDPARMRPAVINAHRPPTPVPRQPHVRMPFPDLLGDVRRARVGTRVLEPRVAGEVVSVANSYGIRVGLLLGKVLSGAMKEWYDASQVCQNDHKFA